ncbi:hypothetical protein NDU88_001999 [Pleurodeles waltl]|uniref:Uncharacterized protein n=1 Tax=Pleurodeles waltl TaxID=8319 RepID=A0AAV7NCD8_PLEWA|nr:hypothetical protein NDU88_001999 [Pleurodeles waltl]
MAVRERCAGRSHVQTRKEQSRRRGSEEKDVHPGGTRQDTAWYSQAGEEGRRAEGGSDAAQIKERSSRERVTDEEASHVPGGAWLIQDSLQERPPPTPSQPLLLPFSYVESRAGIPERMEDSHGGLDLRTQQEARGLMPLDNPMVQGHS